MSSHLIKILILSTLSLLLNSVAQARYSDHPKLGINVGDLGKLTSSVPFTDIFKSSRGWFTSCEFDWRAGQPIDSGCTRKKALNTREQDQLHLDGDGWVRSLPRPEDSPIFTSVTSTWRLSDHFPTGHYVVLYDGEGMIKITGDLKMGLQQGGQMEFNLLSPKRNLRLQITQTDPRDNGNYIRNIRIVPKKNEKNYNRQIFNPDYVNRIAPLHALRFMPWSNPRSNGAVEWNERTLITSAHYSGKKGIPAERMVDLANMTDTAPWFSVPYKASDNYMLQYARMVKNRLRKHQTVYVEFSNEVWNSIFPSATYAARKADSYWKYPYKKVPAGKRRVLLAANWYAKRSVEMCQIWKKEFGSQKNRVKCVMGSLSSVPWLGKEILDCPLWKEANGCGHHIDAYGIGPYFGEYIATKGNRPEVREWLRDADGGKNRLFREIFEGGVLKKGPRGGAMARVKEHLHANKKLADQYGLELLAYEAGQHLIRYDPPHTVKDPALLNLFMSVQNDPRMRSAYAKYLRTWASVSDGLLLHFYGIGQPEPRNFFGMLAHPNQPSSPKYLALMDYLDAPPVKPQHRRASRPVVAPIPAAPRPQVAQQPVPLPIPPQVQQLPIPTPQVVQQLPIPLPVPQPIQATKTIEIDGMIFEVEPDLFGLPAAAPPLSVQPSTIANISGAGVQGWSIDANSAVSPEIRLRHSTKHSLDITWNYVNPNTVKNAFFRITAIDHKGGEKVIFDQFDTDIQLLATSEQQFIEDINRYVGPPIRFKIESSPGLQVIISTLRVTN
ncbi:MAG: hypothetical protein KAH22_04985 [Thiotrichaceae bacterium]|nr:hypothetical protein [Thiotrichaceae bacterium]